MNISYSLFNIAKKDLEASKILYEKKIYPQAMFFFQQSVEKAAKSLFIEIGAVEQKELKTFIGHNPLKIINLLKRKEKETQQEQQKLIEKIPELKNSFLYKEEESKFSELELKSPAELENLSREMNASIDKIRENVNALKQMMNQTVILIQYLKNTGIEEIVGNRNLEEFIRVYKLIIEKYPIDKKYPKLKNRKDIVILTRHIIQNTFVLFYLFISLFILSLITFIGVTDSRYPNIERDTTPVDIFNADKPIMKEFKELILIQEYNLEFLKGLQNNLKVMKELFKK